MLARNIRSMHAVESLRSYQDQQRLCPHAVAVPADATAALMAYCVVDRPLHSNPSEMKRLPNWQLMSVGAGLARLAWRDVA